MTNKELEKKLAEANEKLKKAEATIEKQKITLINKNLQIENLYAADNKHLDEKRDLNDHLEKVQDRLNQALANLEHRGNPVAVRKPTPAIHKEITVEKLKGGSFVLKTYRGEISESKGRIVGEFCASVDVAEEMTNATLELLENHMAGVLIGIDLSVTVI